MYSNRRTIRLIALFLTATSITPAAIATTWAQQAAQQQATAQDATPGLEEIVVTSRKEAENIIEVPIAVTAITADAMQARGITDFTNLEDFTPGFRDEAATVNRNDRGYYTFTVRGIYPADDGPNRQAASIFLDGTPVAGGVIAGLSDIERVEVVNGPQSAYFGRSTFSGAVNFITRDPSSTPSAMIDASAGQWGSDEIRLSVEGPLEPGVLTGRVSFRNYDFGGQYHNLGYGGELGKRSTKSGAIDLHFTPNENFRANAYFTYWADRDGPSAQGMLVNNNCNAGGAQTYFCGPISSTPPDTIVANHAPTSVLDSISAGDPIDPHGALHRQGLSRDAYQAVLSAAYDLPGGFTLTANGGYSINNWQVITDVVNQYPSTSPVWAYVPENLTSQSGEIRLSSPQSSPLKYRVGFNYAYDGVSFDTEIATTSFVLNVSPPELIASHTYGLFGGVSYDFTDKLTLDIEMRAQLDQLYEQLLSSGLNQSASFDSYTPRISLRYQLDPSVEAYVSYAEGTRPGQFNLNIDGLPAAAQAIVRSESGAPIAVPEEHLKMGELGLKGDFLDDRLRVLSDIYYGYWSDINVGHDVLYPTTNNGETTQASITVTEAGGSAELYGFELQGSFLPTPHVELDATFDYAGSRVVKTNNLTTLAITGNADPVGTTLPRYPVTSGTLSGTYTHPIGGNFDAYGRGDYIYTGRQYGDNSANIVWIPGSSRVNLHVGVKNERYTFELYGTNVFNNKTALSINQGNNLLTGNLSLVVAPAILETFGGRVIIKF